VSGRGELFLLLCLVALCGGLLYIDWLRQAELSDLNERLGRLETKPRRRAPATGNGAA
jgi:hypothetical protein